MVLSNRSSVRKLAPVPPQAVLHFGRAWLATVLAYMQLVLMPG
jgi:hypothetical protein